MSGGGANARLVLWCLLMVTMAGAWVFFRRYAMPRPSIGVMNRSDVVISLAVITAFTFANVVAPVWVVELVMALGVLSAIYYLLEPVTRSTRVPWLAVTGALALECGARIWLAPGVAARHAINDVIMVLTAAGVANVWAQSGMRANDAALFAAGLAVYDEIVTVRLPWSGYPFTRLAGEPFAPMFAWPSDGGEGWLGLGLGDVLVATVFVLVMRKAYGRFAAAAAFAANAAVVGVLLTPLGGVAPNHPFPLMVALGPVMVLQYAGWRWARGKERTTRLYLELEPRRLRRFAGSSPTTSDPVPPLSPP